MRAQSAMRVVSGNVKNFNAGAAFARDMSTLINKKEMGEEAVYIKRIEHERAEKAAALKASVEEILSREDHDEKKQDLLKAVGAENKEDEGILQSLGLTDWRIALPLALTFGGPMIQHEVIIIDGKFYILATFTMFFHAFGAIFVPLYNEMFGGEADRVAKLYSDAEASSMNDLNNTIEENERMLLVKDNMKSVFALRDDLYQAQAEALNKAAQHEVRAAYVQKLDALLSLEEAASVAIRQDMISSVKAEVAQVVATDKKVKEGALAEAIAALSGGKRGSDVVGNVFKASIQNYKTRSAEPTSSTSQIMAKLQKDADEICQAPATSTSAGNVYDTHRIEAFGSVGGQ